MFKKNIPRGVLAGKSWGRAIRMNWLVRAPRQTGKSKRMSRSDRATSEQIVIWERHRFENRLTNMRAVYVAFVDI